MTKEQMKDLVDLFERSIDLAICHHEVEHHGVHIKGLNEENEKNNKLYDKLITAST